MTDATDTRQRSTGDDLLRTLLLLVVWFFVAVWLGVTRRLVAAGGIPIGLGAAIAAPLILLALDRRRGQRLFGGFRHLELPALIALQTFRVVGVIFVVAWWGGSLPAGFALPAGIGDVAIGLTAPFVAAAIAQRRRHHATLARLWNVAGTADLIIAVTSGVLHGRSPLGLLAGAVPTDAMARYPLSLIPTFLVPLALILHISAFRALAVERRASAAGAPAV